MSVYHDVAQNLGRGLPVRPDTVDRNALVTARAVGLDRKGDGPYRMVSFFAKRARGAMASWIIRNRVKTKKALTDFDVDGYRYAAERSSPSNPVSLRDDA